MKKLLFAILLLVPALAHAEKRFSFQASTNSAPLPQWKEFISEAIYNSSSTCSGTGATSIAISTSPALLFAVHVTSAGAGSPILTIYDSPAIQTYGSPAGRLISGPIDATKVFDWRFSVATSSGIWLNSSGGTGFVPPCVNVIYTER